MVNMASAGNEYTVQDQADDKEDLSSEEKWDNQIRIFIKTIRGKLKVRGDELGGRIAVETFFVMSLNTCIIGFVSFHSILNLTLRIAFQKNKGGKDNVVCFLNLLG